MASMKSAINWKKNRKRMLYSTILDIIDDLISKGRTKHGDELREKVMAVVACHSAIRAGEELSNARMKRLVEELYSTDKAYSCPHGRPTVLSLSRYAIEKMFKRKL